MLHHNKLITLKFYNKQNSNIEGYLHKPFLIFNITIMTSNIHLKIHFADTVLVLLTHLLFLK